MTAVKYPDSRAEWAWWAACGIAGVLAAVGIVFALQHWHFIGHSALAAPGIVGWVVGRCGGRVGLIAAGAHRERERVARLAMYR